MEQTTDFGRDTTSDADKVAVAGAAMATTSVSLPRPLLAHLLLKIQTPPIVARSQPRLDWILEKIPRESRRIPENLRNDGR